MNLRDLIKDQRISIENSADLDEKTYTRLVRDLSHFKFWPSEGSRGPKLWEHQDAAVCFSLAYLCSDRKLSTENIANEAALVKMATGTGKSAVITVLSRCLPKIKKVLVLTPREALTDQLYRYVRRDFWSKMGLEAATLTANFDDDGSRAGGPVPAAYVTKLLPSTAGAIVRAAGQEERLVLVGTLQALDQIRRDAAKASSGDPAADAHGDQYRELLRIVGGFDLVIIDEGHYEPAISWSRDP